MEKVSVTFETKFYENDWKILPVKGRLERMIDRCNYDVPEIISSFIIY